MGSVNPTLNVEGAAAVPTGALYYKTPIAGGATAEERAEGLRAKRSDGTWQTVGGTTYTAGPNIAITGTSINTAPFLGGVGGIFITGLVGGSSGTATDPHGIYLNPGMALRVESGDDASLNVGNYFSGAGAGDNFHLRIHSPDAAISELVLDQGGTDRWTIGARTPSRNFEIWRNNPTGTWAPSLQINFSDGSILASTRFGVGAGAPYPQDKSVGIERHFTVGGRYENTVGASCPTGTFPINLNTIRGGSGLFSIDAGECYRPDITGATLNQSVLSGRLNMFGDARFREDITVDGDTEVQGLTANSAIRAKREIIIRPDEDTSNARLPWYLMLEDFDNDPGNGNPATQYALRVKDEDNTDWFNVRRTGYSDAGAWPADIIRVTTPGIMEVGRLNSTGYVVSGDRLIGGGLIIGPNTSASSFLGAGQAVTVQGNMQLSGSQEIVFGGGGTGGDLTVFDDLTVNGDSVLGTGGDAVTIGGTLNAAGSQFISTMSPRAGITNNGIGGVIQVGTSGTGRLRIDDDDINADDGQFNPGTLHLQRYGGDVEAHGDLKVGGGITAGSGNSGAGYRLTSDAGGLKMAELADEDWDERNEGRLIVGYAPASGATTSELRTCRQICEEHGLPCDRAYSTGGSLWSGGCTLFDNATRYCWCG